MGTRILMGRKTKRERHVTKPKPQDPGLTPASKTLAEQAFWKFFEDEKPSFDGVTINPPLVLGPVIHQVKAVEDLNTSVGE